MKSTLYFRSGDVEGFTSIKLAEKQQGYATPIRELLQNSLDACSGECKIDIYIESIKTSDIPHLEDYKNVLQKSIETLKRKKSYNANSQQKVAFIEKALCKVELRALMFVDNGSGMSPDKVTGLIAGRSVEKEKQASGSYGVGHLSCYSLSDLRYVLYATKYEDEQEKIQNLFTGSPILAGHEDKDEDRCGQGRILQHVPQKNSESDFVFPDEFPPFIQKKMDKVEKTGSLVAILGLNEPWDEEATYAIVSNYFHAIDHGLSITIHKNGDSKEISHDEMERLVAKHKTEKNRKGDSILSGKAVYQALHTVRGQSTQKDITLANSEKVHVCIKTDPDFDSAIVLVRNGMVVARHDSMLSTAIDGLRKNSKFEPFTAVIDVNNQFAPDLFGLVKGAENPYHNKLQAKQLSYSCEKRLKEHLKELSEGIKERLSTIERKSFCWSWFATAAENAEARATSGITSGQSNQADKKKNGTRIDRKTKKEKKENRKGRKVPKVTSRELNSSNSCRYEDQGSKWDVHLEIGVSKDYKKDQDDVYLSIYLGEDNDQDKVKTYLELLSVTMDGKEVSTDTKTQVKLGRLRTGEQHNIVAKVKKPPHIGKVALLPILSLKKSDKTVITKSEEGQ